MSVTLPYPSLASGAVVDQDKLNSNFSTLANKFGTIDNSDVKSGAGISIDKLSASYEYLVIRFMLDATSTTSEDVCPIYNDGKGDWTYVATQWACNDNGDPSAVFTITWGQYNGAAAPGAFTVTSTIDTITLSGTANTANQASDASPAVTSLASGTNRALRAAISTNDADAGTRLYISSLLKRQIKT